ncbi:MAG: 2-oxoacid:acceptor oxidoreductase subunit alpha [Planctomycetota bacterium]|nr:2-oxoacid:acceptor oxidoreductase subunit alpha [Planctomycetota bacterium]
MTKNTDKSGVRRFLQGNEACALGALAAGCRFYGGYPITPSSEIMEHMAAELPKVGGVFVQMEDEIASIAAVIGASWAGAKAMTATSGPGLSLMIENIGYACITETPCVVVDIQRAGPATGQATCPGSGDVMQIRWGSHGDYEIIALAPWSVQEMYDLTIEAFRLSETYRVPTFIASDESIGHLREIAVLTPPDMIPERAASCDRPPFGDPATNAVTPMPGFGQGRRLLVTGSTHDERGYRRTQDSAVQAKLVARLCDKIKKGSANIWKVESFHLEDAETVVIAYGSTARAALRAVRLARAKGVKAGMLRLITLWPFPDEIVAGLSSKAGRLVVPEMNQGQVSREVQRCTRLPVIASGKSNGEVVVPGEILPLLLDEHGQA